MMRFLSRSNMFGLMGVVLIGGCAQPRPFDDLWVPQRPYQAGRDVVRPPEDVLEGRADSGEQSAIRNPTGEITLRDAVQLALRQNHALAASGWAATAAEADAVQMGRPRNPTASLAVDNFAGPDAGDTFQRQTLRLSQVIELADKRGKRLTLGQANQRLRAWDYEQLRLDVAAKTAARYVAVVVSQRRVELAKQQLALAESGFEIASDRFRNGTAPGLERDQAAVRVTLSRIALDKAEQSLVAARADLVAMWGGTQANFDLAAGQLAERVTIPPLDELKNRAMDGPAIARWNDEIEQRRAAVQLERAKTVTDPAIGAGVRYFSDAEEWAGVLDISWPLAVLDDNRSAVLAARLRLAQARSQQAQAQSETGAALSRAYARLESAAYSAKALDQDALPSAESAYKAALESYRAGQSDFLIVLDAERSLLEVRNQQLDVVLNYHQSLIEVEQITAHALDADPKE